jgi:hypothetical protein
MLRAVRDALRAMIAQANRLKALEADLVMLLAYATVLDDLQRQFDGVGRTLSKLERTHAPATAGGGTAPNGCAPPAGGGGGGAPVDKGPRMARSFIGAGAPIPDVQSADIIPPDNPLFLASKPKELRGLGNPADTQFASEGQRP